ncbi:hypothetical protein MED121_20716 [Marinomonas sp. MED121]|uniref:GFA family protein n=1 Tax=Marinomonas sp. MED121 TaxID=314277 RepID=UPI0000690A07|nr:GFA family protein [Marinomonas sp. MED121]EAQ64031.1 hypothetical protein MED121_20716 [Marinomonas sp. MED121]
MKGYCLCGDVSFLLTGDLPAIYQCHCSLCRRVSGSSSNSAIIVPFEQFKWLSGAINNDSGQQGIRSFSTKTGFKSDFCLHCGSPVPNLSADSRHYWVPAGLLEGPMKTQVKAHVYTNSRAEWDTAFIKDDVEKFAEMPSEQEWLALNNTNKG